MRLKKAAALTLVTAMSFYGSRMRQQLIHS